VFTLLTKDGSSSLWWCAVRNLHAARLPEAQEGAGVESIP